MMHELLEIGSVTKLQSSSFLPEGAGSLLSLLKAKGWATGLSAGVGEGGLERSTAAYIFEAHIWLSVLGLEKVGLLVCSFKVPLLSFYI